MSEPTWISAKDAAKKLGYAPEYVARLCKQENLKAKRDGQSWLIDEESLKTYEATVAQKKELQARTLSRELKRERREVFAAVPAVVAAPATIMPRNRLRAAVLMLGFFAVTGVVSASFFAPLGFGPAPKQQKEAVATQTTSASDKLGQLYKLVASSTPVVATTTIVQNTYPVIERTIERASAADATDVSNLVTYDFLNAQIDSVYRSMSRQSGGGGISDFSGLTASDIPALSYLPLAGGTLTGALVAPRLTASATSTLAGITLNTDCTIYNNGGKLTTDAAGNVVCGNDSSSAGGSTFSYPFPSNATTTQLAFNGGATFAGATTTALAVTGSTTISSILNVGGAINANGGVVGNVTGALTGNASTATALQTGRTINGVTFDGTANITITAASSTLLANSNTFSGTNTFSNPIVGSVTGNAGTVTNGVYTTTFNALFDPRFIADLAATTSIASITTLPNLSILSSQVSNLASTISAAYPFQGAGNSTSTLTQFNGGLTAYASSTIGNGTATGGLTISGGATTTGNTYLDGNLTIGGRGSVTGQQLLVDVGVAGIHPGIVLRNSSGADGRGSAIQFESNPGVNLAQIAVTRGGDDTQSRMQFFTRAGEASASEKMRIDTSGNLGIGTTTPSQALSVQGNGLFSGNFTAANITATGTLAVSGNTMLANATTTSLGITGISGSLLKTTAGGSVVAAIAGTDYQAAGNYATFSYPFPSNATTTSIAFNGGLTGALIGSLVGNASTATALQTGRTINGVTFDGTANIVITAASSTLLADSNTFSGSNTFSSAINGSVTGNAGTVTNGVYTTTFGGLFDTRLSATTTLPNITTLANLSLPSSQVTGLFAYPFPSNATSTLIAFNGGLTAFASTTIGNGTQAGGLTISGGATTTGTAYFAGNVGIGVSSPAAKLEIANTGGIKLSNGSYSGLLKSSDSTTGVDGLVVRTGNDAQYASLTIGGLFSAFSASAANGGGFLSADMSQYRTIVNKDDLGTIITASGGQYSWNSATGFGFLGTADTGLARQGAGVVKVTDGSAGLGSLIANSIGVGTTSPGSIFSVNGVANFAPATSTFYATGGINLAGGCYAVGGTCLSAVSLGASTFAYPFPSNATSTLIAFNNGLTAYASSTIGNGTATGGLTISGNATTTGTAYFGGDVGIGGAPMLSGVNGQQIALQINRTAIDSIFTLNTNSTNRGARVEFGSATDNSSPEGYVGVANSTVQLMGGLQHGYPLVLGVNNREVMRILGDQYSPGLGNIGVGSTSPFAKFSIGANPTDPAINTTLFAIGSSTASATTTLFSISNTGNVLIGQSSATSTLVASTTGQLAVLPGTTTIQMASKVSSGSSPYGVYVQGRYAYVSNSNSLLVFDVSNSASPIQVGSISTNISAGRGIYVAGRYAYVTSQTSNLLTIFDVSNPASPAYVASTKDDLNSPQAVYVQGRYAYVANYNSGKLVIFDVSNPSAPARISSISTGGSVYGVSVQGRYAYAVSWLTTALKVYDVSNPASPVQVGSVATGLNQPQALSVQGRYAYVASYSNDSLVTFDISNPASPVQVSSISSGLNGPTSVSVQGRYAYVTNNLNSNLVTFDISNPAYPAQVSSIYTGGGAWGVSAQGRYAYVTNFGNNSFAVFDLGGAYIQQLEAGGIETGSLSVRNNISAMDASLMGSLNVGSSLSVSGGATFTYASTTAYNTTLPIFSIVHPTSTVTGVGTTTGSIFTALANGNIGIGTSSPLSLLAMQNNYGSANANIFQVASSTSAAGNASTNFLTVSSSGFGTTTLSGLNINGQATSTSNVGINITAGCYAVNGTCLSTGGASLSVANTWTALQTFSSGITADTYNASGASSTVLSLGGQGLLLASSTLGSVFLGMNSGTVNQSTGIDNSGVGAGALASNTTGTRNSAFGFSTLASNTSGTGNTAAGFQSMQVNSVGINNSAFGYNSLASNVNGFYNTAVGSHSLYGNSSGVYNTASGYGSLAFNSYGNYNNAFGSQALYNNGSGSYNSAFGSFAGLNSAQGTSTTLIGSFSDAANNLSTSTALGAGAFVGASNSLVLGGLGANSVLAGVGTTSPFARFSIQANPTDSVLNATLFAIGSSTASATSTLFSVSNTGSTTIANGINITAGCYAVNGACLAAGGGGSGGGQLLATYATSTPGSNVSVNFGGASGSAPSFSGATLTLPSNTSYVVVETWGAGGGGGGSAAGGTGGTGGSTCFGTNATACTSPTASASGGAGGTGSAGGGSGGATLTGDVKIAGGGGGGTPLTSSTGGTFYSGSGAGGSAAAGGGGAAGVSYSTAGAAGNAFGGGGSGGGANSIAQGGNYAAGGGGGGGGYAKTLITNPGSTYYYTVGAGGTAGTAGSTGGTGSAGGVGGAGGIAISVYTTGVSNGSIGSGTAGQFAFFNGTGTNLSATSSVFSSANSFIGIGTTSPTQALSVAGSGQSPLTIDSTGATTTLQFTNAGASQGYVGYTKLGSGGLAFLNAAGTTANLLVTNLGSVGVGTTTPWAQFSINPTSANGSAPSFAIGSSTGTKFIVTNAGKVGIGTQTPDSALELAQATWPRLAMLKNGIGTWYLGADDATNSYGISLNAGSPYLSVSSGGNVNVGGSPFVTGNANIELNASGYINTSRTTTVAAAQMQFANPNGYVGSIVTTGSATAYNTSSDRRLKENIATTTAGLGTLLKISVDDFNFIKDPSLRVQGFIAQDLYAVYPEAVTTNGDSGVGPLSSTTLPWSVDYGRLTPLVVQAIQDLNLNLETIASTSATTTPASRSFAASFFGNLFARVTVWLADAGNGITDLFAERIHAQVLYAKEVQVEDKVCIKGQCFTESDVSALLELVRGSRAGQGGGGDTEPLPPGSTSTPLIEPSPAEATTTPVAEPQAPATASSSEPAQQAPEGSPAPEPQPEPQAPAATPAPSAGTPATP